MDVVVLPPILPTIQDTTSGLPPKRNVRDSTPLATRLDGIVALQDIENRQPHNDGQEEDNQDSGLGSRVLRRVGEQEDEDDLKRAERHVD